MGLLVVYGCRERKQESRERESCRAQKEWRKKKRGDLEKVEATFGSLVK